MLGISHAPLHLFGIDNGIGSCIGMRNVPQSRNAAEAAAVSAGLSEIQPEDVLASAYNFMDRIWARSKFTDIISAELADIALVQCWSEDVLASPLSFMDRIWARSNGADVAVRDGLALLILREVQTSEDPIAFKKILDRAEFFVPCEQELLFCSRVRSAYYKVCLRLGLPSFKSNVAMNTVRNRRGQARAKRARDAPPIVIHYL